MLDLYADVAISFNGETLKVQAEGNRIIVAFPTLRAGMKFLRRMLGDPQWAPSLRKIDLHLCNLFMTLYIQAGRVHFGLLGMKANPDILTLLLGLHGIRRRLGGG